MWGAWCGDVEWCMVSGVVGGGVGLVRTMRVVGGWRD